MMNFIPDEEKPFQSRIERLIHNLTFLKLNFDQEYRYYQVCSLVQHSADALKSCI